MKSVEIESQRRNLTLLAYFLFIFNGMLFISTGVLMESISVDLKVRVAEVGLALFIMSVSRTGIFFLTSTILKRISMKTALTISLIILGVSSLVIINCHSLWQFTLGCILMGIGSSFTITIPNYIIVSLYIKIEKFKKLNILNATFAIGGTLSPFIVGSLLQINVEWRVFLWFVLGGSLFFIIWGMKSHFPKKSENSMNDFTQKKLRWNFSIYLIATAMLCYVISESTFCLWAVTFFQLKYDYNIFFASSLLTLYWLFITIGRSTIYLVSQKIRIDKYIGIMGLLSIISYSMIFLNHIPLTLLCTVALLGLSHSTLYASILSYGTDQVSSANPSVMMFFVICGSTGGISAPFITSIIENYTSVFYALFLGNIAMIILFVAIYFTKFDKRNPVL
ncbi:MAG: MFS transporter [Fusobacteria bacterium]|nr:MFS transporter [Fusobacteriota bacterium]